ncbi:MAG: hypothetical protein HGA49_11650 [Eubacteriaceae bacterium]|nr:hypothetical protein [Eubacteriaceae bacterium]
MMNRFFAGRGYSGKSYDGFNTLCGGFGNGTFPWGGLIMGFVLIVLIGAVIYILIKNNSARIVSGNPAVKNTDYYISLLKESYAKGQITDEEFEKKVKTLRSNE